MVRRGRAEKTAILATPASLEVRTFALDGESYALIEIPLQPDRLPHDLSPAEREVCGLLLAGQSHAAIAAVRGTSIHTVRNQIRTLYAKLGVHSRSELLRACAF